MRENIAMVDFVTLSCPTCGGELQITDNIERFACAHCGREHLVIRSGGIVALSPVVQAIERVGLGVDKTASELAILRLQKEIAELMEQRQSIYTNTPRVEMGGGGYVFFAGFIFIVMGIVMGYADSIHGNFFSLKTVLFIGGGLIIALLGIFWVIGNQKVIKKWELSLKNKALPIENEIRKKQAELTRNKQIVSQ
jgi:predicted RNA-binding Zn-ribbon protein involved in translation (DUF1610 family)